MMSHLLLAVNELGEFAFAVRKVLSQVLSDFKVLSFPLARLVMELLVFRCDSVSELVSRRQRLRQTAVPAGMEKGSEQKILWGPPLSICTDRRSADARSSLRHSSFDALELEEVGRRRRWPCLSKPSRLDTRKPF